MRQSIPEQTAVMNWLVLLGALLALVLTSCGGGGGGGETQPLPSGGTVAGLVVSSATGAPLAGVAVSAGSRSATTGADGRYSLTGVPQAATQVVDFTLADHAPSHATVAVSSDSTSVANARLTPVGARVDFPASAGTTVTVPNSPAQVVLPAAGLVTASGSAATGSVTARVTAIDAAANPGNMPGNGTARTASGGVETIESFGAVNVQLNDASGARLNLAPGKMATIRIPLATRSTAAPGTMPLYYFDETTGLWVAEGTATLRGTAPNQYYEGTVGHFTTWNAATPTAIGTGGAGLYLLGFSGPETQGDAIQFANGSQTVDGSTLSAVRAVSPTGASTIEAAGTAALLFQPAFEATVSGGQVSDLHERFAVYFKNGRLYQLDLQSTGDVPTSQLVSSLTPNQVCGDSGSPQGAETASGIDLADATRTWVFLQGPGTDGVCGTTDDRYRAVRLNMSATADAPTIGEPLAEVMASSGAFAGLVVREGNLVRRLDADLLNPTTLFTLPAGTFSNDGVRYGGSLPGIWLFRAGDGLYGYDLGSSAAAPTRLATLSLGEQGASFLPTAAQGSVGYVALNGDASARILRLNGLATPTSVATGVGGSIEQIDATPTRAVFLVRYDLGLTTLQSVPAGGGTPTMLVQDDDTWITASTFVSGDNVYTMQQGIDGVSSSSVYRTVVVGADGSARETRNNTAILGALLAASTPIASFGSDWYALLLADNVSTTTGYGGSTLRAEAGATRSALVTYGQVQPTPESIVLSSGIGPVQYGQPGLLAYFTLAGSTAIDLIHFDSDAPGLTKVTGFNPTTMGAPARRERTQQLQHFPLRKLPRELSQRHFR